MKNNRRPRKKGEELVSVVCSALENRDRQERWKKLGNSKAKALALCLQGIEFGGRRYVSPEPFRPSELLDVPSLPGRHQVQEGLFLLSGTWGKKNEGEPGIIGRKPLLEPPDHQPPGKRLSPDHFSISTPDPDPDPFFDPDTARESLRGALWDLVRSYLPEEMIPQDWPPKNRNLAEFLWREAFRRSLAPVFDEMGRRWCPDPFPGAWVIGALKKAPVGPGVSAYSEVVEQLQPPPPISEASLLAKREKRKTGPGIVLVRFPGVISLLDAPLVKVARDNDPELVATAPFDRPLQRYGVKIPLQRTLFPGPMTLEGNPTAGTWIDALAELDLLDNRSTIRSDLFRFALIIYALPGSVTITEDVGAILVGGRDTPGNRIRFWTLYEVMRSLHGKVGGYGGRYDFFDTEAAGNVARIGAPAWWRNQTGLRHYRLSGGLLRLPSARTGNQWKGGLFRSLNGIETALLYGPTSGKKKGGRESHYFQATTPGGPGPEVFVRPWQVLRFAGENVTENSIKESSKDRNRYKRRVEGMYEEGYFCTDGKTAPAGDTIEITRQVKGGRNHPGGLYVRASALGCAMHTRNGSEEFRFPGSHLVEKLTIH